MVANHETGEIVQTEVNETGRYERMLTVRLEEAELETAKSKAARKLSREMKIKGFRPGKAPRAIVERMVGADHLRSEAVDEAIPEAVQEALEETDLEPATVPRVSDVRDGDDGGLEVDVVVTLWPVVDAVPDFDGREVEVEAPVLTEEEIEGQIDALRNQFAGLGDVERDAGVGDFVVVDITISAEGEEIEDTAANDLLYEIGSESFIAGLDEILVGLGSGGSAEGPATLPAGFTDRGGEEVTLHVSVKEVKEKELPELTDEFVSDVTDFETVEELRQRLELNMRALRVHNARAAFEERLIEQLIADLDLDLPGDLVDAEVEARVRNLGKRLEQDSIEFADYLEITGQDEAGFIAEVRSQAVSALSTRILIEAVVSIEGLEVEDAEYREALESYAASTDSTPEEVTEMFAASGQEVALRSDILRRKAIERLVDAANAVDADGNPVDLTPIEIDDLEDDEDDEDEDEDEYQDEDEEGEATDDESPEIVAETEE
jgi:trigger factor